MRVLRTLVPQELIDLYHRVSALLADWWFEHPSRSLIVIGVTGTNGKTTTTHMIAHVLKECGRRVGFVSTIALSVGGREWTNETKMTSLKNAWQLQKMLRLMVSAGDEIAIIETTSHALHQHRVDRIFYDGAVLTNVTREHLDYHKTMEEYRRAKELLFGLVERRPERRIRGVVQPRFSVVNIDDPFASLFLRYQTDERWGYGLGERPSEVATSHFLKITAVTSTSRSVQFQVNGDDAQLVMPGQFSAENASAAIAVAGAMGIPRKDAIEALKRFFGLPGRMERVDEGQSFSVYIDYAVTPDSFQKLADVVRHGILHPGGKWWWVFGACGERDRGKRPEMGEIAARSADYVVLTNEDPWHEDPERIVDEIEAGVVAGGKKRDENYWRMMDRADAIRFALQRALPGDVVTITGKGAETAMAIGDTLLPWNERAIVRKFLREIVESKNASS